MNASKTAGRKNIVLMSFVMLFILTGCSLTLNGLTGGSYTNPNFLEQKMCSGSYILKHPLKNGDKPKKESKAMRFEKTIEGIDKFYVAQSSEKVCWSASLETVFRYSGLDISQEQFQQALGSKCPGSGKRSATANQIIFAASEAHAKNQGIAHAKNQGTWMGKFPKRGLDIDFCDVINLLSLLPGIDYANCEIKSSYPLESDRIFILRPNVEVPEKVSVITMSQTNNETGKVIYKKELTLIKNLPEMLIAMDNDYPVFVAMNGKGGGHTAVLRKIVFRVNTYEKDADRDSYNVYGGVYLDKVEYLDPLEGPEPQQMSGKRFLSKAALAFYVKT